MITAACGRRIVSAGFLTPVLCFALGCGGDDGGTQEAAPSEAKPAKAAKAKEETPDVKITDSGVPGDFPSDVPIYPGAEPQRSLGIPGGPMIAAFSSDDDAETILTYYVNELPGAGWTVTEEGKGPGALRASKANRSLNIRADGKPSGATTIAIVVNQG